MLAVPQVLQLSLLPVIFALFMTDFFDTMGTMIAVAQEGKLLDEEGRVPQAKRILLVDSLAAILGGAMGASSVTSYIESGSGVAEGGRTGMTSVVVGLLFLLALPFSPLDLGLRRLGPDAEPAGGNDPLFVSPVTAPALIVVGFLMMTAVRLIPWDRFDEAIPAFLTILTLPLTFNISYGIGFGFISYVLIKLSRGKAGEVHPLLYGAAVLFALAFVWPALQGCSPENSAGSTGVYACSVGGKTGNSSVRYGICYIALAGAVRWERVVYAGEVKAHRHRSVDSDRAHSRRAGQVGHAGARPRGNHSHCLDRHSGSIRRRFHSPEPLRAAQG